MTDQNEVKYLYFEVCAEEDLPEGERLFIDVGETPVVLLNLGGKFFAIGDCCTHDEGPLGDGEVEGTHIICPRHGARFDLLTGDAVSLPAVEPTPVYPVRVRSGKIEIGISTEE